MLRKILSLISNYDSRVEEKGTSRSEPPSKEGGGSSKGSKVPNRRLGTTSNKIQIPDSWLDFLQRKEAKILDDYIFEDYEE